MPSDTGPLGSISSGDKTVHIIGAGVAGLLMGYYLKKSGRNIHIYEASARVGGKINTISTDNGIYETAANAIFTNDDVWELLNDLKLNPLVADSSLKKLVWKENGPTHRLITLSEILKAIFSSFKKIDKTNLHKKSIYEFFSPFLGKYFTAQVMSAALRGIYALPSTEIHFKSLFKTPFKSNYYFSFFIELIKLRRHKKNSSKRAQSISFENGMIEFINALKNELSENIQYQSSVKIEELHGKVIICTDAKSASLLTLTSHPQVSKKLNQILYNKMSTTTVFKHNDFTLLKNSFGVVLPPHKSNLLLGILNNSSIFKRQMNLTKSYTFICSKQFEGTKEFNQVFSDQLLTFPKDIIKSYTTNWDTAIPLYTNKRFETIKEIRQLFIEDNIDLVLFGNYIDGISIREMISHAKQFAN